ncbi:MAG: DUF362 domain-containing protein [Clostridia bacterium]|nr:DUF362 domain-containing protein [Clostridia bacterium]
MNKRIFALLLSVWMLLSFAACADTLSAPSSSSSSIPPVFDPSTVGHTVYGEGFGINPGRVSWAQDPALFDWTNTQYWWDESNFNTELAAQMVSDSLCAIAGTSNEADAWDALFKDLNLRRYEKNVGHTAGEKIAIKLNMNAVSSDTLATNAIFPTPCMLRALLSSMVLHGGVCPEDIVLYDVTRVIPTYFKEYIGKDELAGVQYVYLGSAPNLKDDDALVVWSSEVVGDDAYLPTCVSEATYIINYANMKMHTLAGFTVTTKNHFGSIVTDVNPNRAPATAGLHELICATQAIYSGKTIYPRPYGSYTPMVDIIANQDVGQKTLLYFVDAVVTTAGQNATLTQAMRWETMGNQFPCSIFMSQDPIAIDSVCLDFLLSEPNMKIVAEAPMDNYLIEAATVPNPPSDTVYKDGHGNPITESLGVHEHWYDAKSKEYSRNKGADVGIELIKILYRE